MKTIPLSRGQISAASKQGNVSTEPSNEGFSRVVPYRPHFCQSTIGKGAAARTASLVYQQLKFWSRHSQHQFEDKLWFYKSGEELAEELSLSVSTVRRALKRLLSLGLLVRQQWWKHRYNRVYFWHLPQEPETVKRDAAAAAARKHRVKGSGSASTTAASPEAPRETNRSLQGHRRGKQHTGCSSHPQRSDRSGQNDQFLQKKTSLEELTYRCQQLVLGKTKNQNKETGCSICLDRGTIEVEDGSRVYFARCSCSSGDRYQNLPLAK
jgi:biotin operon repressor